MHPHYRLALADITQAPAYRYLHLQWDQELKRAKKERSPMPVKLSKVPMQPFHLYYMDAGSDPRDWRNRFMGLYYYIPAISGPVFVFKQHVSVYNDSAL